MKKFKINVDKPDLTDETILKNKPAFDNLIKNIKPVIKPLKPFYKSWWFAGGAGAIAAAATIVGLLVLSSDKNNNLEIPGNKPVQNTSDFVYAPFPAEDIAYERYYVSDKGTQQLKTKSGTCLSIPENAFADSLGKTVAFPVEVKYREFRNPVDFFVAGIPMNYDSAGVNYTFESSGMMEVRAFKDGHELTLAAGKAITVDMPSPSADRDFNVYYLDTVKRCWQYVGKDRVAEAKHETTNAKQAAAPVKEKASHPQTYISPRKADKTKFVFNVAVNLTEFPELGIYSNILFQVSENEKKFSSKLYSVKWTRATLLRSTSKDEYCLQLQKNDTTVKILVNPVFDEKGYKTAIEKYNMQISTAKEDKSSRDAKIVVQKQNESSIQLTLDLATQELGLEMRSLRTFDISTLGMWNCDRPLPPIHRNFSMAPKFVDNAGKSIRYSKIYIVDLSKNALFYYADSVKLKCNRNAENVMWFVTPDNRMGVIKPDDFSNAVANTSNPVFNVTLMSSSEGIKYLRSVTRIEGS